MNWLDKKEQAAYKGFMTEDGKGIDQLVRKATSAGRPLGTDGTERFIKSLEKLPDCGLLPKKAGTLKKKMVA